MKKIYKVLIALVVIVAVCVGVYFIFFNKSSNGEIYTKINNFNNTTVNKVNIVQKVDETMVEMVELIDKNSYDIPTAKNYLTVYLNAVNSHSLTYGFIVEYGLFTNQTNNTKPKGKITVESSTQEVKNITKYLRGLLDIAEDLAMDSDQLRKLDEMIDRFEIVSKQKTTKETIAVDKLILNIAELFKAQCVNQSISGASYYLGVLNSLLKDRASGVSTKYSSPKYCEITLKYHKLHFTTFFSFLQELW